MTYGDLLLVNDIRNAFAHSLHEMTFANGDVIEDCLQLQLAVAADFRTYGTDILIARNRYLVTCLNLMFEMSLRATKRKFERNPLLVALKTEPDKAWGILI